MPNGQWQPLTDYPPAWNDRTRDLIGTATLDVAGYATEVQIAAEQLNRALLPLLAALVKPAEAGPRVLAGLAGIPGGGKSCFAAILARVAQCVFPPGFLAVVGLDGWHWPNAVLDQRTTLDASGRPIPLCRRKGGPESYDVAALIAALKELRAAGRPVRLPVYDRRRHDPVPEALTIDTSARIVLIEGNYLLNSARPWDQVGALLTPKLFLTGDPAVARQRIIARHIRGGASQQQAEEKFETNDRLNIETVLPAVADADLLVESEAVWRLRTRASDKDEGRHGRLAEAR